MRMLGGGGGRCGRCGGRAPSVAVEIVALVPRISAFYGIVIEMYFGDHPPPHFHARYGGGAAKGDIARGAGVARWVPGRGARPPGGRGMQDRHQAAGTLGSGARFRPPPPTMTTP